MAGPASRIEYISDNGTHYTTSNPNWQNTIAGNAAATATALKPSGIERRYRLVLDPGTGREWKVVVGNPASTFWTNSPGTTLSGTTIVSNGEAIIDGVLAGAIGERRLFRG